MRRNEPSVENSKSSPPDTDVFNSLQQERVLFLTDEINSDRANNLCGQLLLLDMQEPGKDIVLYINSEGGNITDTLAIYDVMQAVRSDVVTICIGEASSGAAVLLSAGASGKRYALPNARVMLHQPQGGIEGSSRDVEIEAKELVRLREQLGKILANRTGQPLEKLHSIMDRDAYMDAMSAKEFGVIDAVIARLPGI